jgi:hypothetical protein
MQNSVPRQKSSVLTKLQDLEGRFPANFPEKYGDIETMRSADVNELLRGYGLEVYGSLTARRQRLAEYITGLRI